jgi:NADH dehydrogenase FAD-containing subunit
MMSDLPVVIVGAGVVGLVLAQALKKVQDLSIVYLATLIQVRMEYRSSSSTEMSTSTFVATDGESLSTGLSKRCRNVFRPHFLSA